MKKNRQRLIKLGIALVLFFLIITFKDKVFSLIFPQKINKPFANLKIELIKEIELVNVDKTINLYKKDNSWFTKKPSDSEGEFKANEERINKIITASINLIKDEVVSQNKNRHLELGINNSKVVLKGDKQYILYVGNASGVDKNYLRINQENDIFTASGFSDIFTSFDYRDLNVNFVKDENKVQSFEIIYGINDIVVEKNKNSWLINEKTAKKDRIDFFLNDLKTLKANDILPKETFLPYYPEFTIKLKIDNKEQSAEFYLPSEALAKEGYYLKTSNSDFVYQVPTAYVSSLKKEEKDFTE